MAKRKAAKKSNVKKVSEKADTTNTEVSTTARSFTNLPVFLKVCRLCESKDGPFLNIFDSDKATAKKIENLMPFKIAEYDDLPHKICFRCSAKVEELYEFVQKCIKAQENLSKVLGSRGTNVKTKLRELWEEKLNQSNLSNDDLCNAVIKKAMEGIKNIPLNPQPVPEDKSQDLKKPSQKLSTKTNEKQSLDIKEKGEVTGKDEEDDDEPPPKRITRLSNEKNVEVNENKHNKAFETKITPKANRKYKLEPTLKDISEPNFQETTPLGLKIKQSLQTNNFSLEATPAIEAHKQEPEAKPFDIMDSVSMIKVNGVGVLFQCKLCNRNFLKKEVVLSHACAKQGAMKVHGPKSYAAPEPPKIPQTVKYITMNVNKEISKPEVVANKTQNIQPFSLSEPINLDDDDTPVTVKKPIKPKIGPASRVKRIVGNATPVASESTVKGVSNQQVLVTTPQSATPVPNITASITSANQLSVQFPTIPSLNSRYRLTPGPNNTFTLVEDSNSKPVEPTAKPALFNLSESNKTDPRNQNTFVVPIENTVQMTNNLQANEYSVSRPYPVGLIKSISATGPRAPAPGPPLSYPPAPAKKHSYTVVQTGNPSKLLISTKPQPTPAVEEQISKKKSRKSRNVTEVEEPQKQPFSVTIEDAGQPTDPGIFTFINVDPLLQPSYVLPTNNIIQESQISTSTNVLKQAGEDKNKYECSICKETFNREKKLATHFQLHFVRMDEEDAKRNMRVGKHSKKREKK